MRDFTGGNTLSIGRLATSFQDNTFGHGVEASVIEQTALHDFHSGRLVNRQ